LTGSIAWRPGVSCALLNAVPALSLAALGLSEDAIGQSLGVPPREEIWLAEALLVGTACTLPLSPFLQQRLGAARAVRLCIFGFLAACLLLQLPLGFNALTAALFLQGAVSAPLLALSQTLAVRTFPSQSQAMAFWNAGSVLGVFAGTVGALAALALGGWQLIFWLGWPAALLGLCWLPSEVASREPGEFDLKGFLLLSTATASASWGLSIVDELGGGDPRWLLLVAAVLCGAGYVHHALRVPAPLVRLGPLGVPGAGAAIVLTFFLNALCSGQLEANFLVSQIHLEGRWMVLRTVLLAGASFGGVALGARLAQGNLGAAFAVGLSVTLAGKLGFTGYTPHASPLQAIWPWVVSSVGFWMCATVLSTALAKRAGGALVAATALFALSAQLGGTVGLAILDGVFAWQSRLVGTEPAFLRVFWLECLATAGLWAGAMRLGTRGEGYK
jgi:MFS family permease